jgi:hypothetical protein
MKRFMIAAALVATLAVGVFVPVAYAGGGNPSGTGPPSQSCQSIEAEEGRTPGHSSSSPGSPFNEPEEISGNKGGIGGQHYSEKSQYDVACYHVSQH